MDKLILHSTGFRKSFRFLFFFIAMALVNSNSAFAGEKIKFEKVDIGFSSAIGAGFIQDREGFFWIGSQTGLIKWNGATKILYTRSNAGLSDNTITAVIEDQKGQIWIGTMGGLHKYSKDTNTFSQFKHNPVDSNSLSHESIGMINHFQSLIEDKDGYLWIATQNGLNQYDPETGHFTHFLHNPEMPNSLSNNFVNAIYEDSTGTIWVGTRNGLNRFNRVNSAFYRYEHNPENPGSISHNEVYTIMEDDDGNIWIGTENGLNKFEGGSNSFIRYFHSPDNHSIIADNKITSINKDEKGRLWICHYTKGSITLFNPGSHQSEFYIHNPDNPDTLPTNDAKYVYQDRQGVIWIVSTTGVNICKYDINSHKFITFKQDRTNPHSLNGNSVLPIYEDSQGTIWIGTDKSKLNKYDRKTGKFTYIPIQGYHPYAFLEDRSGTFWVGETTGRLSIFDRSSETYLKSYDGLSSSFISHIAQDSNNASILWLTTHKDGLVKFNVQTEEIRHFRHQKGDQGSLSSNSVWGFWQEDETLWLGTWGGGLNEFHKEKESFTVYKHNPEDPESISSNVCDNLLINAAGDLYISTLGGGLNKFNKTTRTFEHYSTINGLFPSDDLEGLLEDVQGNLWIASSTEEIIKFDINTKEYKSYGPGDGIEIGGPWFVANYKTRDGQMWFGGPKGVTAFYPGNIKNNIYRPPVYITALTQGGEPIKTNKALERLSQINISWERPFFEFEAAALNYTRSEHNRYRYKLEGWDTEWFDSGVIRNGRYSNLTGGTYTLRIKASNNDGIWCRPEQEVAVTVLVTNPFWKTWWFYLILACAPFLVVGFTIIHLIKLKFEIRERKHAEDALRNSEEKYRDLIDNVPDLRYRTDLEGKIVFISPSVHKLSGYTVDESMGMKMAEEVYANPEERNTFLKMLQKEGTVTDFEAQLKRKDGSVWWASTNAQFFKDKAGNILGVEGVTRDVTERKNAETALRSEKEFTETALNSQQDTFFLFEFASGKAIRWNRVFNGITGYTDEEIAEMPAPDSYYNNGDLKRATTFIAEVLETGASKIELDLICKDGRKVPTEYNVSVIQDAEGQPRYCISIGRDVTERKKAEEEKGRLEAQLQQALKMEAVGTLSGGIAHDFNNILGIIVGNTELAFDDVPDWNPARHNLDEIKTACMRARDVVRQLLSFSRKTEQLRLPVKINDIVTESMKLLRASIPATIDIKLNIPEKNETILADATQIHQVLINLCTNAAHAMEAKGGILIVNVTKRHLDEDSLSDYGEVDTGYFVQLSIDDTGHGIEPEIQEKMFDPYYTTKEVGKGTGMGLAVVHGIVKNHNGAIAVRSEPGKGTSIKVLFPLADVQAVPEETLSKDLSTGTETILFVDDELALARTGGQIIERLGYQVETRTNPIEALDLFLHDPSRFDLIVTNMTMPLLTGEQLAKKILKAKPDMPIILCTGFSGKINRESAGKIGIRKYIEKPLNKRELSIAIREVLDEK